MKKVYWNILTYLEIWLTFVNFSSACAYTAIHCTYLFTNENYLNHFVHTLFSSCSVFFTLQFKISLLLLYLPFSVFRCISSFSYLFSFDMPSFLFFVFVAVFFFNKNNKIFVCKMLFIFYSTQSLVKNQRNRLQTCYL